MNAKTLKWIGIITMTIDHIGFHLIPDGTLNIILRSIGRIAYPLFAFMIAEGFHHTSNVRRYLLRLLIPAVLFELIIIGFYLLTGENYILEVNVFIPLFLGLFCLYLWSKGHWAIRLIILPILFLSEYLQISYGVYGLMIILIFGLIPSIPRQLEAFILLSLFIISWPLLTSLGLEDYAKYDAIQWFSILAFIPIILYNGKQGHFNKWFFYAYYPVHLGIIMVIKYLIG